MGKFKLSNWMRFEIKECIKVWLQLESRKLCSLNRRIQSLWYAIQKLGTLESFVNCCCAHIRDSGCKGSLKFVSPQTKDCPRMFEGTLFSVHTVKCSECGMKFSLESDFFEAKPIRNEKLSLFSRISQVCGVASKNMSWVFAEMEMLFACLGVSFFFVQKISVFEKFGGRWSSNTSTGSIFSRTPQFLKTVILFPNLCKEKEYPYRANFSKLATRTWTILSK